MDEGDHGQEEEEDGRRDIHEEEDVVADAAPVLHNGAMEDSSLVAGDAHDDGNYLRGNQALFHSAFGRSPLLSWSALAATRRVASFASSFFLGLELCECCANDVLCFTI